MLELGKGKYTDAALNILRALEHYCDFSENEDSILRMGSEAYYGRHYIPIIYGDFFFAEAIYKLMGNKFLFW